MVGVILPLAMSTTITLSKSPPQTRGTKSMNLESSLPMTRVNTASNEIRESNIESRKLSRYEAVNLA